MRSVDHFQLGYSYYQIKNYYAAIGSFNKISKGNERLKQNAYYHLGDCHITTIGLGIFAIDIVKSVRWRD